MSCNFDYLDEPPFISPEGFLQLLMHLEDSRKHFLEGSNWIHDDYYNKNLKEM